jgi:hypothetical protein
VVEVVVVEVLVVLLDLAVVELVQLVELAQDLPIQEVAVVVLHILLLEIAALMVGKVDQVSLLLEHQVQLHFQWHLGQTQHQLTQVEIR